MSRGNVLLISFICVYFVKFVQCTQFTTFEELATTATSNNHHLLPRDAPGVRLINYVSQVVCSLNTPLIYYYYEMDTVNRKATPTATFETLPKDVSCTEGTALSSKYLEDSILRAIHQCEVAVGVALRFTVSIS